MANAVLRYRKLNAAGDMVLGDGPGSFYTGVEAIRQAIETRLKLLQGEWWERPGEGLPLYQQMLGRRMTQAQQELMDLLITERIMDTRGVIAVTDAQSEYENRRYHYSARVRTEYGDTTLEVTY